MNSKKLVAQVEKGDGWRSGRGGGWFPSGKDLNGEPWGGTWHLGSMRGSPHGPSEVTVEEVRIANHFPAVEDRGTEILPS